MNTEHTPGPWKRTVVKNENQVGYVSVITGSDGSGVCEVQREANARLIAAAPALLEALEAISALRPPLMTKEQEKSFEHYQSTCDAYRVDLSKVLLEALTQARQAIATAKGESK